MRGLIQTVPDRRRTCPGGEMGLRPDSKHVVERPLFIGCRTGAPHQEQGLLSACALSRLEPLLQTPTTVPVLRTRLEGVAPNPLTQEDISLIPASVLELRFSVIGHCMGVPPAFLAPSSHLLDPRPQVWGALVEADSLDEVPLTARHHQSTVDQAEVVEQGHIQMLKLKPGEGRKPARR